MLKRVMPPEQAWEIIEPRLKLGVRGYYTLKDGKKVYRNEFIESLEKYPMILKVVEQMQSSLADITTESKGYVRSEFMKTYSRHAEQSVQIGHDTLKLGVV
jgi:hypothetical protein